ncbi:Ig-like domain-containing protein [Curtobacterium sp. L1-20]|uniref:Ig-like domain-containing protein n=1 Tax=Curtobacterium sp. L1-20 TaxID=3138181 RepID=UPI003B515F9A
MSGTATPRGTVTIGSKTVDVDADGKWSMTVEGLAVGENKLTAKQRFNNADVDEKQVTVTIVEGGTVVGVDQGPIKLARGESTQIPMVVQNNEFRANWDGTVVLNAPQGTTFDGQTRIDADFGGANGATWEPIKSMPLTNGRLSNDDKTITFDADWASGHGAPEQYRYMVNVTADDDAAAGAGEMGFTFSGDSSKGDFRATGKTTTNLDVAKRDLSADVESVDHAAGTAVIGGTATPGATITIGDKSTEVAEDGSWSLEVDDLTNGQNPLMVEQKIGDEVIDTKDLVVTINDAAVIGQDVPTVTLERGETTEVETQFKTQGDVSHPDAKVTFTAPEGTTFADGQDTIQGGYKKPGDADWTNRSVALTDGDLSMDGKTYTYTFKPTTSSWTLPDASLLRWGIDVETPANAAEGASSMSTTLIGTAVEGSFNATSATATTVADSGPAAPSATGFFDDDVAAWAGIRGQGAANATIVVKNTAGEQIASTTANGTGAYEVRIDPSKVGFGEQKLVVTQTVNEATSDGMDVTLDYGQNDPKFTSPTEGGSLPNRDFTLTGTGNAGGKISMNGVDLRNDDAAAIGSADVTDGRWTVRNTDITLPNGPYQFWAHQRTKGGKIAFAGLNVTMEQPKPAMPTANGYFPEDVALWAGIDGRGAVGATVTAKNAAGDVVADTVIVNADGSYNLAIDPNKVGDGKQELTVTQTVNGAPSDGIEVELDYGFNTPKFTSPSESSVVPNRNLTFTGTGNAGGRLQVNGVDLSDDATARIGEAKLTTDAWTITNNEITLPTGFYQLWATQQTKGGKIAFAGLNVQTVPAAPAAPTAVAFFGPTVETWGAIAGTGEVGAEIIVRDANDKEIARTEITEGRGTYTVGIDPSKVGWGEQRFTVTQTVGGVPSKGIIVSLDYGQQTAPTITSPTFGQRIDGSSELTFTGTGSTGSKVVLTGTDFTNDSAFGDTTVRDGRWSITSKLDLPAGNYQFWASERTQGGKWVLTAVDVNITD